MNVISGDNGHGKTSLLEAIYFAATSRSFRATRPAELVRHDEQLASSHAHFEEIGAPAEASTRRDQLAVVKGGTTSVRIDGVKPQRLSDYATRSPVVVFHVDEITLSSGPATKRRTLLDRLALFTAPLSADHRSRYALAVRSRQRLLQTSGSADALFAFEDLCARHGAAVTTARASAATALAAALVPAFTQIVDAQIALSVRYTPGGTADADEARAKLAASRARDAHRPSPGFGPHRDDLELLLDGHPARIVASQGQHRALALALKAAEATAIARARGVDPILLLDDISSELDPRRTAALFVFLAGSHGQIFLTTTRRELIITRQLEHRRDFRVENGQLEGLADT